MRILINLFKIFLNIVFYIVYTVFSWFIVGFLIPIVLKFLGKPLLNPYDPIFNKIAISIAIFVFVITVIFRKVFYLSLNPEKNNLSESNIEKKDYSTEKIIEKMDDGLDIDDNLDIIVGNK